MHGNYDVLAVGNRQRPHLNEYTMIDPLLHMWKDWCTHPFSLLAIQYLSCWLQWACSFPEEEPISPT